jgi:hypothetical protein
MIMHFTSSCIPCNQNAQGLRAYIFWIHMCIYTCMLSQYSYKKPVSLSIKSKQNDDCDRKSQLQDKDKNIRLCCVVYSIHVRSIGAILISQSQSSPKA